MAKDILDKLSKIDINKIDFDNHNEVKACIITLFNVIEKLVAENAQLREQNQLLKDEINKLKGEKGKPNIKPNVKKKDKIVKLSEFDKKKKKRKKTSKKNRIKIDREEVIEFDKSLLPEDAEFKGYAMKPIQNIVLKTDNVLYKLETYYSKKEHRTYTAKLPDYLQESEFGAEIKALIYTLYYECRVTEPKIAEILNSQGIIISEGTISNILIYEKSEEFKKEKENIFESALEVSEYHQVDDTGMRVNGVNHYANILCNDFYAMFSIRRYKNRDTVLKIINELDENVDISEGDLDIIINILIADDAPQFKKISEGLGLCWIHEERHYQKMIPVIKYNKELIEKVRESIWNYYGELKEYKDNPCENVKIQLWNKFDEIFLQTTGYEELDKRLRLTYNKKEQLLLVLDFPFIPLHNNESEISAREIVTKRKISGGVRTEVGKTAWENALSIYVTCKKNKVCFYEYMLNIFKEASDRIKLSDIIKERKSEKDQYRKNCLDKTG